ncbi:DnaB-like helicase C-terminal domain-containing protein [Leclercia sp.]|uniref:replicative DNA helicase n=1 Tax=Leclercia sp. TaxID=1898428 RepID=UPI0028AA124D|nr:DnaB-like helicase C-terminal domain-containing protein [Leclercia sp.]
MDSLDFETQLVSSMMINGDHPDTHEIIGKLPEEAFANAALRDMYRAVSSLIRQCEPTDPFTVRDVVHESFREHVLAVSKSCISSSNMRAWAKRVRQAWMVRIAKQNMLEALQLLEQTNTQNINDNMREVAKLVNSLEMESNDRLPRRLSEILPDWVDVLEKRMQGVDSGLYLKVGIEPMDDKYGGFGRTDLIIIAGQPGMGKTELAVMMANYIGSQRGVGLFVSMEMSEMQVAERHIADRSNLSVGKLRNPLELTDEDYAKMSMAIAQINEQDNYVIDQTMSVDEIIAHAERLSRGEKGLAFLAVDYLGLIIKQKAERNDIAIGDITRKLKKFSLQYKVPVLLLCQLNRKVADRADKRPIIQDLRDSGSIEQDADAIIFPYRDEVHHENSRMKGIAEIIVAKYRHGEPGTFYMGWRNGHFVNVNQEEVMRRVAENERDSSEGKKQKGGWM